MKKYFKLILTLSATTTLPIVAVSCSSTSSRIQSLIDQNLKTKDRAQSEEIFKKLQTEIGAYEKDIKGKLSSYNVVEVNIPENEYNIQPVLTMTPESLPVYKIDKTTDDKPSTKIRRIVREIKRVIKEEFTKYVLDSIINEVTYTIPEGNTYIAPQPSWLHAETVFSKVAKTIFKIGDQYFTIKYNGVQPNIVTNNEINPAFTTYPRDFNKDPRIEAERIKILKELKQVHVNYSFSFDLEFAGIQLEDSNFDTTINFTLPVNPQLYNQEVKFESNTFKPVNINWADPQVRGKSFNATILSVSDGDTFEVKALEEVPSIGIKENGIYKIRLSGIDTPEKAVGDSTGSQSSSPFEYGFALLSTHFAEKFDQAYGRNIRILSSNRDAFGRYVGDAFFGDDYQFSYNTEIVRAGYTLPLAEGTWKDTINEKNTYANLLYRPIAHAMQEARERKNGFWHYFNNPNKLTFYIYRIKPNNSFDPFIEIIDKSL
ncbi:thermonuclease family protein [Mycoplasma sp. Pen4]|uniref:thermonuclease family protein n=1 Tax=Mycoplasma sp. Pen4 TaxID=640330 RepID=UPI001654C196|nr:thermonuclease family protein [Mycoplasma sp. Pen4]QNM93580.1 thermonuclease family protein [Mycoplasma sp. Pen4]